MNFLNLPKLGIGLAADVGSTTPDYRSFIGGVKDRFDYFNLGAHYNQLGRVKHYIGDLVESSLPIVFHPINFDVVINVEEDDRVLRDVNEIAEYVGAVWMGQDAAVWTYNKQYLGQYMMPPILDNEAVNEVVEKVKYLSARLPCPFLIENPPVSFAVGELHMLDFMNAVCEKAVCGMVLDIGHLVGYQQAIGCGMEALDLSNFSFERVVEVHLAGLRTSKAGGAINFIDQHKDPISEASWAFLEEHLGKMKNLKGITLEQEYCSDELVREHLGRVRNIALENGF